VIRETESIRWGWRHRAAAGLAVLLSLLLVGGAIAPPAVAATGTAEVTIGGGGADYYFAGTSAMIIGQVKAVEPSLGWPTGSVTIISKEPGNPTSEADLFDFQGEGGYFSGWAYPTEVGVRQIIVKYSGDATFAPKSQVIDYVVPPGPVAKTTLSASPAGTVSVGQKVTFTSNTTDDEGRPLEGEGTVGWVSFYDNGVRIGDETDVTPGTVPGKTLYASVTTTFTTPGTHTLTASFQPSNPFYDTSTSEPLKLTVAGKPTPTPTATPKPTPTPKPTATATPKPTATATPKPTVTPRPEPTIAPNPPATATVGGSITVTPRGPVKAGSAVKATVEIHAKSTGAPVPGAVQFYDGKTKVGKPVTLVNGQAHLKYTRLTSGAHVFKAKYLGTDDWAAAFTRNVPVKVR